MAFDVLFNFLANVDKLRQALEEARQEAFSTNQTNIAEVQRLKAVQDQADAAHRDALNQLKVAEEQLRLAEEARVVTVKKIADLQKQQAQPGANVNFIQAQINAVQNSTRAQQQAQVVATRQAQVVQQQAYAETTAAAQRAAQEQTAAFQQAAQAQQRITQNNLRQQLSQIQQIQASQQKLAGLGFALQQQQSEFLRGLGGVILSGAFGGPMAAAFNLAGQAFAAMVSGAHDLVGLLTSAIKTGYDFSQTLELSRLSMAAIIAQTTVLTDRNGQLLNDADQFNGALAIAGKLQQDLLAKVLKTNITYEEANRSVEVGIGFLTSQNVEAGRAQDIIINLASLAKTLGFEGSRAAQQVRAALTGTRGQLSNILQAAGLTRSEIQKLTGDELAAAFERATKFAALAMGQTSASLKVQLENVTDSIKLLLAQAFEPVAKEAGAAIQDILNQFITVKGQFTGVALELQKSLHDLFHTLFEDLKTVFTVENVRDFIASVNSAVIVVNELAKAIGALAGITSFRQLIADVRAFTETVSGTLVVFNAFRERNDTGFAGTLINQLTHDAQAAKEATLFFNESLRSGLSPEQAEQAVKTYVQAYNAALDKHKFDVIGHIFNEKGIKDEALKSGFVAANSFRDGLLQQAAQNQAQIDSQLSNVVQGTKTIVNVSDLDLRNIGKLQTALSQINKALAAENSTAYQAAQDRVKALQDVYNADEKIVDSQTRELKKAQDLKAVQDAMRNAAQVLANQGGNVTVKISGKTVDAQEAQVTLQTKINQLQDQYNALLRQRAELEEGKARIEELNQQTKSLQEQLNATIANTGSEDELVAAVRRASEERIKEAQAAYETKLAVEAAAEADLKAAEAHGTEKSRNEATLALQKNHQATLEAEDKLLEAQNNYYKDINTRVANIIQTEQQLQDKIQQGNDLLQERQLQIEGVAGAAVNQAKFSTQLDREVNALDAARSKAERQLSTIHALQADTTQQTSVDNIIKLEQEEQHYQNIIDQIDRQRAATIQLKVEAQAYALIQANLEQTNANLAQLDAERALAASRVNAGMEGEVSAAVEEYNLRTRQLDQIRQQINDEQELLDKTNARIAQLRAIKNRNDEEQAELTGLVKTQTDITTEIIKSQTAANNLLTPFERLLQIVKQLHPGLAGILETVSQITDKIGQAAGVETNPAAGALGNIQGGVGGLAEDIDTLRRGGISKENVNAVAQDLGDIATGIIQDLTKFKGTVSKVVNTVADTVSAVLATFGGPVGALAAAVIQVGKQVFNFIASIFGNAAKEMATDIQNQLKAIKQQVSEGTLNLSQEINALNVQLDRTYELERKRGGKDQAIQLRDQIQGELDQLHKSQEDIIESFRQGLAVLQLGPGFAGFANTIVDTLKKINEFIGAGGSIVKAKQFLSLTLRDLSTQLQGEVATAQLDALNRAKDLLDLEQQRADLIKQNAQAERDILTQGLAERQLTSAEQRARALYNQNSEFKKQLSAIDQQIASDQALLDVQKKILGGTVDLNNLQAINAKITQLSVAQEQQKLAVLLQQQQVIAGIVRNSQGLFTLSPALFKQLQQAGLFTAPNQKLSPLGGQPIINLLLQLPQGKQTKLPLSSGEGNQLMNMLQDLLNRRGIRAPIS